jgi:hypothetical protein
MNFQQAQEILETIKTFNINSQSAETIVRELKPILYLIVLKPYFFFIAGALIIFALIYIVWRIYKSLYL